MIKKSPFSRNSYCNALSLLSSTALPVKIMKKIWLVLGVYFLLIGLLPAQSPYCRIEIPFSASHVELLGQLGISVDYIHEDKYLWIEIGQDDLAKVQLSGIPYTILIEDLEKFYLQRNEGIDIRAVEEEFRNQKTWNVPQGFSLGSMGGFYTYSEILAKMDQMRQSYPQLISARQAISGIPTVNGNYIYWQRISNNPDVLQNKPRVLYNALIHAREPASMQQLFYFMFYLLENYTTDSLVKSIIDHTELYFIPCLNPDGYIFNQQTNPNGGGLWRKNRRNNGDGSFGVDNNRNFGYMWGYNNVGSSPTPSSLTYRGPFPFSEVENQLTKLFCEQYNFSIVLNCHTYGSLFLHPWSYVTTPDSPHHSIFHEYSYLLTLDNGYRFGIPGYILYVVNGEACDWMYGEQTTKQLSYAFTPEIGTNQDGFWPQVQRIIPICQENLSMNLMAARLAGFYAQFVDLSPPYLSTQEGRLLFTIKRLGLHDIPFQITFEPLNNRFISLNNLKSYSSSQYYQPTLDSVNYVLQPDLRPGDEIRIKVTLKAAGFQWSDTLVKVYGKPLTILYDDCSNMSRWSSSNKWNISTLQYLSPPTSIGNAPVTAYSNSENTQLILNQTIDLTTASNAWIKFNARWDLNGGRDYIKPMVSVNNGQTWVNLKGRYTSGNFVPGEPQTQVFRGNSDGWIQEWFSLKAFCGSQVLFGFWFSSDASAGRSGFFFDNFSIEVLDNTTISLSRDFTEGWNNFALQLIPLNQSVENIFSGYENLLSGVMNFTGVYIPALQLNTLNSLEVTSGYFLKANAPFTLNITGYPMQARIFPFTEGWNFLAVPTSNNIPISSLTVNPPNAIQIIWDPIGAQIFWPDMQIQNLYLLEPGKGYLFRMSGNGTIRFTEP